MEDLLHLGHAVVSAEGRTQDLFEQLLAMRGIEPRVVLTLPHFLSIPFIAATPPRG